MSGGVQWSPGLLLIDGKLVGACSFDADLQRELVEGDGMDSPPRTFSVTGTINAEAWREFLRETGIAVGTIDPYIDLTVWAAIDPSKPMPILNVSEHTEVITQCKRGGGSIGRVWCGARLERVDGNGDITLSHEEPLP